MLHNILLCLVSNPGKSKFNKKKRDGVISDSHVVVLVSLCLSRCCP